jgi:predicted dehydrogenase
VKRLGFGIYGAGAIARDFALGLRASSRCRLVHVCSRTHASALALSRDFDAKASETLDDLLADPEVDALYVATPHPFHEQPTLQALARGKHVLCEKPLAPDPSAAARMLDAATSSGRLLVEGYMYRCHPLMAELGRQVQSGVVGKVRRVDACFGFASTPVAGSRLFEPGLAGGAIWDIGGYPLSFALFVAGLAEQEAFALPERAEWSAELGPTGVDEHARATLLFASDVVAELAVSIREHLGMRAVVTGERGRIELFSPWLPGGERHGTRSSWTLDVAGRAPETHTLEAPSVYALEADAFAESVLRGCVTWPSVGVAESRALARLLAEWRAQAR